MDYKKEDMSSKELLRIIEKLESENEALYRKLEDKFIQIDIPGKSKCIDKIKNQTEDMAKGDSPALIVGEAGTGKKSIASAIHNLSLKSEKPFFIVQCPIGNKNKIFESELLGYEKGAFIGAVKTRKGLLEKAAGGTMVFYGLNKLSPEFQSQLVDILSGNGFKRIGGTSVIKIDVRIIAINEDTVENDLMCGKISEHLYEFFENGIIRIPPLRERKADIIHIANYFTSYYAKLFCKKVNGLSTSTMELLLKHYWPCNIAELESVIESAVVSCESEVIQSSDLPPSLHNIVKSSDSERGPLEQKLDIIEYDSIIEALKLNSGSISQSAKTLGVTERMLGLRIKKYNIENKNFS